MAWIIKIKLDAEKEISRFDKPVQKRIYSFITDKLAKAEDPRTLLDPYTGALVGYWKKRIGDYRLVIAINDKTITIEVIKAGHRSKVYK